MKNKNQLRPKKREEYSHLNAFGREEGRPTLTGSFLM